MNKTVAVDLFLTARVILVGGFLILLPHITRKGLILGAYVGEGACDQGSARDLVRGWTRGCLLLMAVSLVVGLSISVAGWPVAGNYTGTGVLLLGAGLLYLRFHSRARALASPAAAEQAATATAPLVVGKRRGAVLAWLAVGICSVTTVATFVYALDSYRYMSGRSFAAIMSVPSLGVALGPFLAVLAVLTAGAKRSLRGGSGGRSLKAQEAFRATMTNLLAVFALVFSAYTTYLSLQIVRFGLGKIDRPSIAGIVTGAALVIVFILTIQILILTKFGQGGALMEAGGSDAPLTNGIADNTRWLLGLFYVDKDDPSVMVEKRFGFGYSFNYGNPVARVIVGGFVALSLGLTALLLVGTFA
jgi:uncharacterized membrane protein